MAVVDGRLQLRRVALSYVASGYFRVEVKPEGRDISTYIMNGKVIGTGRTDVGRIPIVSGNFGFPIQSKNTTVTVTIVNDSFLPCSFMSAAWEGQYNPKGSRTA